MAELTVKERLQPSLLDRLTDDEPDKNVESRDRRVISLERLRECVMRDLGWLLNTGKLSQVQNLDAYPGGRSFRGQLRIARSFRPAPLLGRPGGIGDAP